MKRNLISIILVCLAFQISAQQKIHWKKVSVLVYTKNGKGYVHDNIPAAVKCIQQLGMQYGFKVDSSGDAVVMTAANLKKYTLLIFTSTNNDVFDTDEQRLAFRQYIESGGGFVGIHSVTGTERNWKWFKMLVGGTFAWHAKFQKITIKVIDPLHPSVQGLPKVWEKEDEFYFTKELYAGTKTVMANHISSLDISDTIQKNLIIKNAGPFADLFPAVWTNEFDGGHAWITTLGHDKKDYEDPLFIEHIFKGISFIAGLVKKIDSGKAYATAKDTPLRY